MSARKYDVSHSEEREGFIACHVDDTIFPGQVAVQCTVIPNEPLAFLAIPGMIDRTVDSKEGYVRVLVRKRDERCDEVVVPFPGFGQDFTFVLAREQVENIVLQHR